MKKKQLILCMGLSAMSLFTSCNSGERDFGLGQPEGPKEKGTLILNLNAETSFEQQTRAVNEDAFRNTDNYNVKITDSKGNIKFNDTFATLKTRLPMDFDLGSYTISASYGKEFAASRDNFLSTGSETFTIGKTPVETTVKCTPTAGKLSVEFDASMDLYCDTYSVDFTGTSKLGTTAAHWGKGESAPYYLTLNEDEGGETVNYTIYLTAKADYAGLNGKEKVTDATATGNFKLERNKWKKLIVKANYTPSTEGGLKIVIEFDERTNDKPINIEVPVTWI